MYVTRCDRCIRGFAILRCINSRLTLPDMCRKMARTGDSSSEDEADTEVGGGRWRRPPPSDDECDETITLKSHHLRSLQRDPNIVLNIRVRLPSVMTKCRHHYYCNNFVSFQPVRKENEVAPYRAEMRMIRWMCVVVVKDRFPSKGMRERLGIEDIILALQQNRLPWYGHLLQKEDNDWVKKCVWSMKWRVVPDPEVDQRGLGERLCRKHVN